MQQEDDLRALAKIMDFLRAVSILLVVMNIYWYCYEAILTWGVNIGVVNKILIQKLHQIEHYQFQFSPKAAKRLWSFLFYQ